MVIKTCEFCKDNFDAFRITQRFCSKSCMNKQHYRNNMETYKSNAKKNRPKQALKRKEANKNKWFTSCDECDIEFKKNCNNQKYCSIKCQRVFLDRKNKKLGKVQEWSKKTYQNHKSEYIKKITKYQIKKRKNDPMFCMIGRLRARIGAIFRVNGWEKKNRTYDLLGCTTDTLKKYFESKFTFGMTWDNKGEWHIDHIIPLSSAKTEDELFKLCHYTNLQPLWAKDNLIKSNKC